MRVTFLLLGLLLISAGCSPDNTVTAPKEIPAKPSDAPSAGGGKKDNASSASAGETF